MANLLNHVTGSKLKLTGEEGKVDMCKAIDDMRKESEAIGEARGEARGEIKGATAARIKDIKNVMDSLKVSAEKAMDVLKVKPEDRSKYLKLLT